MANQQHVVEHGEHDKALKKSWSSTASGLSSRCPDTVLPLDCNARPLTIGAWNVRTLMDSSSSDRSERRTALVRRELDRYKVEITALSETRLAEEGLLKEVGAGCRTDKKRSLA